MKALCYIAALSVIAAILVVSTSFTERRNVKTWAPNAVIAKPKPFETAAIVSPKPDAATGAVKSDAANPALAPEQSASGAEAPAATRSSTTVTDPESTGTLPKAVAPTAHYVAPNVSPAPSARPSRSAAGNTAGTPGSGARTCNRADPPSVRPAFAGANPVPARRRKKLRSSNSPLIRGSPMTRTLCRRRRGCRSPR